MTSCGEEIIPKGGGLRHVEHVPVTDKRWQAYLGGADPSLFQAIRWHQLIEATYGFPARVAMVLDGETVAGGLPYAEVEDFRGRRRVAFAFADVCEPLGPVWPEVERALSAGDIPWQIRSRQLPGHTAERIREIGVHQEIILPTTFEEAAAAFHPSVRRGAKRAVNAGVQVHRYDDARGMEIFFELHTHLRMGKHRLLPQPKAFFEEIVRRYFPRDGCVLVAELERRPVAAMVLLAEGSHLYYKFGASELASLHVRPNNLLFERAIRLAIEGGYAALDLGISEEEGLIRFKRHLGARSAPVYKAWYGSQELSEAVGQVERALGALTTLLTEPGVAPSTAQGAGSVLYRFFV